MVTLLLCDYDRPTLGGRWWHRTQTVLRIARLRVEWMRVDRTRRGWHVIIAVRGRISFQRIVLLQALLGSDWKRESFNARRAVAWRDVPPFWRSRANVLYERHDRNVSI